MSREQLQKDIVRKLRDVHHYARLIAEKHEEEDIHEFRVNYKKLRALLRMVHPNGHKAGLPKNLKRLYTLAGTIRDLQLHYKTVNTYFAQYDTVPVGYLQHIRKAITGAAKDFTRVYNHCSFSRISQTIKKDIPPKYHKELKNWQDDNVRAVKLNLSPGVTDKTIHDIRKHVKDLAYTHKYLLYKKGYNPVAKSIGEYIDSCVLLKLLEENISNAPADEIPMLQHARQQWQAHKKLLKKAVLDKMRRQL